MFALGIVPAAPGLKFVHQHKAKTYQVLARIRGTSDIRSKRHFRRAESGHGELVDLFSAVLLSVLFCIIALAIVQKITEPTLLYTLGRPLSTSRLSVRRRLHRRHRSGGSGERVNDRISIPLIDKVGRRRSSRIATNGTLFLQDFIRNSPMMIHAKLEHLGWADHDWNFGVYSRCFARLYVRKGVTRRRSR
jgi:hypothetical protein